MLPSGTPARQSPDSLQSGFTCLGKVFKNRTCCVQFPADCHEEGILNYIRSARFNLLNCSGIDVMILKIFSPKNLAEKWLFEQKIL
jgi:hypothetical protein